MSLSPFAASGGTASPVGAAIPIVPQTSGQGSGYTPATTSAPAAGFRLNQNTFTSYFLDGTNSPVNLELGGAVNLQGYLLSGLTIGRLVNGGLQKYTPGTYTWKCPPGILWATITLQAGGGSGGCGASTSSGGGSGGYFKAKIPVTPGTSYTVVVGAGGALTSGNVNGNVGGNSTFNADAGTITCNGGGGGTSAGVGGAGGNVASPFFSGAGISGQAANSSANLTLVTPVFGGLVIGVCGGCGGGSNGYKNGYTSLWPGVNNGQGGSSLYSDGLLTGTTPYGAGSTGGSAGAGSPAGGAGFAMIEY